MALRNFGMMPLDRPRPDFLLNPPNLPELMLRKSQLEAMALEKVQAVLAAAPPAPVIATGAFSSGPAYIESLRRRGFEVLGAGAHSTVLGKPGYDRVIKVYRGSAGDDGWPEYVAWGAKNGYAGGLAPRVYSFKRFAPGSRPWPFYVAVVERMEKTVDDLAGLYGTPDRETHPLYRFTRQMDAYAGRRSERDLLEAEKTVPGAAVFGLKLRLDMPGCNDIHCSNVMVRPDGSVCITDPIASSYLSPTAPRRLRSHDFDALRVS